jgi:hypothetical protein
MGDVAWRRVGTTGNADPILVAAALHAIDGELDLLFPNDWQIVTNGAVVQRNAPEFRLTTTKSAALHILNEKVAHPE